MTQIWPGFGAAPVPTVESIICKPDVVVMVFPAVWAAAGVETFAGKTAMIVIATADIIKIFASWRRGILEYLPWTNRNVSSAGPAALSPHKSTQICRAETRPAGDRAGQAW